MTSARRTIRLPLPRHRIRPGALVSTSVPGRRLCFRLPADVRPGSTVVLPGPDDQDLAVVITLLPPLTALPGGRHRLPSRGREDEALSGPSGHDTTRDVPPGAQVTDE